jgi:hypothetical protein
MPCLTSPCRALPSLSGPRRSPSDIVTCGLDSQHAHVGIAVDPAASAVGEREPAGFLEPHPMVVDDRFKLRLAAGSGGFIGRIHRNSTHKAMIHTATISIVVIVSK